MNIQEVKAKLIKANFNIIEETLAPNGNSILLLLGSHDKVIIENSGRWSVIGGNKDKIEAILATPGALEVLNKVRKDLKSYFLELSKFIGSAAVGGVIGNRADKGLDNILTSSEKRRQQTSNNSSVNPAQSNNKTSKVPHKEVRENTALGQIRVSGQTGTIKFFNQTKGFGFIKPDEGGEDVFVHADGLIDQIGEGDKVRFNVERGKKGLNAVNVKKL